VSEAVMLGVDELLALLERVSVAVPV